ncbi:MAG: coenzyme F420-0:L-glutamate ligase [Candidatus Thorarchaeota archaeon]
MNNKVELIGLKGIPLIKEGDDIAKIIVEKLTENNISLLDEDIFVIAQTIVSKSIGRTRDLKEVKPSKKAIQIYDKILPKAKEFNLPIKDPKLIQVILDESNSILRSEHVLIVETKHGFICANAGIDKSNVKGDNIVTLLPEHPDKEAKKIRDSLKGLTGRDVAIIISDSFGRPFRNGAIGVAIGVSGINPIQDKRGSQDLFGYELQSTIIGQVDNLASAAQLIMGEADEGLPIILIRGYKFEFKEKASISLILREKASDLFRVDSSNIYFTEILKSRRSYKLKFSSKLVDRKIIEDCIDIARWAPSAHNRQHWRYIILERDKLRERLINKMNEKLRIDLLNDGKSDSYIIKKIEKTRSQFLNAPYLILLCLDKDCFDNYFDKERKRNEFIMGIQSVSASAVYFLLSLELNKLAACWYCAPLFTENIVKNVLNLPDSYYPFAFFTVGYPTRKAIKPRRISLNEVIYKLEKKELSKYGRN